MSGSSFIPKEVFEETLLQFFAPIRPYLDDPAVSDIMINGPNQIYVEKKGQLELTPREVRDARGAHRRASQRGAVRRQARRRAAADPRRPPARRLAHRGRASARRARRAVRLDPPLLQGDAHRRALDRLRRADRRLRVGALRRSSSRSSTSSSPAARAAARRRCSTRSRPSFPRASASSSSRTRASSSSSASTSCQLEARPPDREGPRRRHDSRSLPRDAPPASRSHRRRRDPRRRSARSHPGDDLRSRRLHLDAPRDLSARHDHAPRDDGDDERRRHAAHRAAHPARVAP